MQSMPRIPIVIISHSEILSNGIAGLLSASTNHKYEIRFINPESLPSFCNGHISPHEIIIADALSFGQKELALIRERKDSVPPIIGIYFSALPLDLTRHFDAMISIYADTQQVELTIEKLLAEVVQPTHGQTDELTPREKEIVIGVVKGKSNKEIASDLNVSVHTVTTHRRNIAGKLQIHSPAALTIYAIVSKLVAIDEIKAELL
ncbi:MAG: helix-turn-helix transcriptional regulator [Barnesiella sp.]|nr:helix-turn-helix transcriptional regulator [Barnesiella sp.]